MNKLLDQTTTALLEIVGIFKKSDDSEINKKNFQSNLIHLYTTSGHPKEEYNFSFINYLIDVERSLINEKIFFLALWVEETVQQLET